MDSQGYAEIYNRLCANEKNGGCFLLKFTSLNL